MDILFTQALQIAWPHFSNTGGLPGVLSSFDTGQQNTVWKRSSFDTGTSTCNTFIYKLSQNLFLAEMDHHSSVARAHREFFEGFPVCQLSFHDSDELPHCGQRGNPRRETAATDAKAFRDAHRIRSPAPNVTMHEHKEHHPYHVSRYDLNGTRRRRQHERMIDVRMSSQRVSVNRSLYGDSFSRSLNTRQPINRWISTDMFTKQRQTLAKSTQNISTIKSRLCTFRVGLMEHRKLFRGKSQRIHSFSAGFEQVDVLQANELELDLDVLLAKILLVLTSPSRLRKWQQREHNHIGKPFRIAAVHEMVDTMAAMYSKAGLMSFIFSAFKMWCSSTKHSR